MTPELQALIDTRCELANAYSHTIGYGPAHDKVWRIIEYIDKQIWPLTRAALGDF
jgi:hypothetical protein